jgi:hypothetical protein
LIKKGADKASINIEELYSLDALANGNGEKPLSKNFAQFANNLTVVKVLHFLW